MSAAVLRGDALRLPLADESVDLIVTSPPYFALRSYRDEGEHYPNQLGSEETPQAFLEALWAVTAELWRVLKPTGSMFVNLGDKYAGSGGHNNSGVSGGPSQLQGASQRKVPIALATRRNAPNRYNQDSGGIRSKSLMGLPWSYANGCIGAYPFPPGLAAPGGQRWILRAEVIWSKPNGLPESVTDRVRRSHEQWFHMVKSPRYFAAVDEVREASSERGQSLRPARDSHDGNGHRTLSRDEALFNPLGKLPGSVWTVPSEPLIIPEAVARHYDLPDHFAAFPQEWPRRIILGWSPSGICVECGEGRRPVVAKELEHVNVTTMANARERDGQARGMTNVKNVARESAVITGYSCGCSAEYDGSLSDSGREPRVVEGPGSSHHRSVSSTAAAGSEPGPSTFPPTRPAVVLDPFGGTGTVAMVARTLGRFGVSVDLSADYNRLARWRIWESGHGEKAAQRTHAENQGDLFSNVPQVHYEDVPVGEAL